jgi:transcriptional/translational regulatory protein YebC/TACO1
MEAEASPARLTIPPVLLAEIHAEARKDNRPADDVLRDVIERGLEDRRRRVNSAPTDQVRAKPSAAEAVARLLEQREDNVLPDGVTMQELMTYSRA